MGPLRLAGWLGGEAVVSHENCLVDLANSGLVQK